VQKEHVLRELRMVKLAMDASKKKRKAKTLLEPTAPLKPIPEEPRSPNIDFEDLFSPVYEPPKAKGKAKGNPKASPKEKAKAKAEKEPKKAEKEAKKAAEDFLKKLTGVDSQKAEANKKAEELKAKAKEAAQNPENQKKAKDLIKGLFSK
jgi:hypothetical protein